MKRIPFNQFRLLVNFPSISTNLNKVTLVQNKNHGLLLDTTYSSRTYSFFSRKKGNVPIKCKIRTNECGQKVAETYEAKTPSCIRIPPLSKDFTVNQEEICTKLKEKMVTYTPPPPGCIPCTTQKCSKPKLSCPNALTKYLKIRGGYQEVYRGAETDDCKKKSSCSSVKKSIYTGRDCALEDPCNIRSKPQTKRQKPKAIIEDMIAKLKSKKLMKPSGFLDEDLLKSACRKLGSRRSTTCVKLTSSGETSPDVKFGVRNSRTIGKVLEEFDPEEPLDKEPVEVFLTEKTLLFDSLEKETTNLAPSAAAMSRSGKTKKKVGDPSKKPDQDGAKGRKKAANKPKSRRRRRSRWFSKIPVEPNVKGSVIFANGQDQELDDPCRILSVNFSASNLHPSEEAEVEPGESRCNSAVERMLDDYDCLLEKLTYKSVDNLEKDSFKGDESRVCFDDSLMTSELENETKGEEKIGEMLDQPSMVRQKKISKLDKTVKCYTTTALPEQTKKKPKRLKKPSKSRSKVGSTANLNPTLLNVENPSGERYHALTTNNLLIDFDNAESKKEELSVAKSDNSFVKIKDITPICDSEDEKEGPGDNSEGSKICNNFTLLPGLTRPVTQKVAHLNLLDCKALRPVSSSWRKNTGFSGKPKEKVGRKKPMDNLEIKGVDFRQVRLKSTDKTALSWKSRCEDDGKPCPTKKKNYNEKADAMYPLPLDWDYDERVPEEVARKWSTLECPKGEDPGCPVTSEDLKRGAPHKKPASAAAINRCNFDECKNRLCCRKPVSRCRNTSSTNKPVGPGK